MRTKLAVIAASIALSVSVPALATQYILEYSDTFGAGNYGTIDVTGTSTDLYFDVELNSPFKIVDTGGHFAFAANLTGTVTGLTPYKSGQFTYSTGTLSNPPFGNFDVGLNCITCGNGSSSPWGSSMQFHLTGTGLGVQAATGQYNDHNVYFAVDAYNGVNTGTIGAGLGAVPEPATWGLMIMGFGGIGAMLRRRRQAVAVA